MFLGMRQLATEFDFHTSVIRKNNTKLNNKSDIKNNNDIIVLIFATQTYLILVFCRDN